jgi:DNA-binding GntR family transcriptional regulator
MNPGTLVLDLFCGATMRTRPRGFLPGRIRLFGMIALASTTLSIVNNLLIRVKQVPERVTLMTAKRLRGERKPTRAAGVGESLTLVKPASMRYQVVDSLRTAIIVGDLPPGQRVVEEDLCERLGVSRGPVREALRQLEQEGLVISYPYKSTEVATISEVEVRQILMPIRITLEQFGFSHAIQALTEADYAELQSIVDNMVQAAQRADVLATNDLDLKFHELVLTAANQPHCLQLWRLVLPRVRAYFYQFTRKDTETLLWVAQQHQTLLDVLQKRNNAALQKAIKTHILETGCDGE